MELIKPELIKFHDDLQSLVRNSGLSPIEVTGLLEMEKLNLFMVMMDKKVLMEEIAREVNTKR